jgi:hypothetical protein
MSVFVKHTLSLGATVHTVSLFRFVQVETWLSEVEKFMVNTLRQLCRESLDDFAQRIRHEWVFDHAGQLLINVSQITWCRLLESAMDGHLVAGDASAGESCTHFQVESSKKTH